MVGATIGVADRTVAYRAVRASRGKQARAEPVSALYEAGRVHHVGGFAALEDQMTTWTPDDTESPDRLDALVWALTDLLLGGHHGAAAF
jgi:phage terminase large subunit-like protein